MVETFLINQLIVWVRHENIRKIASGKGDDYTTGCLLDYPLFQIKLQNDCNRSKQTKWIRCRS